MSLTTVNTTVNAKALTPSRVYKNRVEAVKKNLPRAWREIFFSNYPNYKTDTYLNKRLENVFSTRAACVEITEILEGIANGTITHQNNQ